MEKDFLKNDIEELLVKYLTGNASFEERNAVREWISESAANGKYFDELKEVYKAAKIVHSDNWYNSNLSWERVKVKHYRNFAEKLKSEARKTILFAVRDILKYAAIIVVVITAGLMGYRYIAGKLEIKQKEIWNIVEAPYGSRVKMRLPDGSQVWLNAGSNLKYSSLFGQLNRTVTLNGEAYFVVKPDSGKQFVVTTKYIDIKVYGTEFNVKAYDEEDIVQTTLVRGSVALEGSVISKQGIRSIKLKPNQTATFYKKDIYKMETSTREKIKEVIEQYGEALPITPNLVIIKDIKPEIYTSWKDPFWYIEKEPLWSLTEKFERRFNVKFEFESENLADYKFTGKLKDETLEQVLNLIKLSAPIEYEIKNNVVILSENKYFKNKYDEMLIRKNDN